MAAVPASHSWLVGVWRAELKGGYDRRFVLVVLPDGTAYREFFDDGVNGSCCFRQAEANYGPIVEYTDDGIHVDERGDLLCASLFSILSHTADQFTTEIYIKNGRRQIFYTRDPNYGNVGGANPDAQVVCAKCGQPLRPVRRYQCGMATPLGLVVFCMAPFFCMMGADRKLHCSHCNGALIDSWNGPAAH